MKNSLLLFALCFFCVLIVSCNSNSSKQPTEKVEEKTTTPSPTDLEPSTLKVQKLSSLPLIDGKGETAVWEKLSWHPIDQFWLGAPVGKEDFEGRYKIGWGEDFIYLLVEITDDQLVDTHPDGLDRYWDDDCVEVFIDEDRSRGNHQYSHNAFAYHIATDYQVTDIGPDSLPHYYNDHVQVKRTQNQQTHTWEIAMAVYNDRFVDGQKNVPQKLTANKKMGFAIAYCDNDGSKERENFIGSVAVAGEDKNRGWIDAGIFGSLILTE